MVAQQVKMAEVDLRDIQFWLDRPVAERIAEVTRLRRAYYNWLFGTIPHIWKKQSRNGTMNREQDFIDFINI